MADHSLRKDTSTRGGTHIIDPRAVQGKRGIIRTRMPRDPATMMHIRIIPFAAHIRAERTPEEDDFDGDIRYEQMGG